VLIQGSLEEYTDSGANCTDQEDGDLSNQVVVSGNIPNMNNPGIYTVSYNCSDSSGNVAQTKHRIVFIVDEYLFFDENEDGFDDNSYTTGFYNGEETGDVNHSGELSITDIIIIIDNILNGE
jgi:hypothetical protein